MADGLTLRFAFHPEPEVLVLGPRFRNLDTNEIVDLAGLGAALRSALAERDAELSRLRGEVAALRLEVQAYRAGRCPCCSWPLKLTQKDGCTFDDCSYRPETGSDEHRRLKERHAMLAAGNSKFAAGPAQPVEGERG